jgi:hypothetical protein
VVSRIVDFARGDRAAGLSVRVLLRRSRRDQAPQISDR